MGHSFFALQFGGAGDLASLRGSQGSFGAPVHSRAPECAGRHPESSVAGFGVGMDPLFSGLPGPPPSVASDYRPLRHIVEPRVDNFFYFFFKSNKSKNYFFDLFDFFDLYDFFFIFLIILSFALSFFF